MPLLQIPRTGDIIKLEEDCGNVAAGEACRAKRDGHGVWLEAIEGGAWVYCRPWELDRAGWALVADEDALNLAELGLTAAWREVEFA